MATFSGRGQHETVGRVRLSRRGFLGWAGSAGAASLLVDRGRAARPAEAQQAGPGTRGGVLKVALSGDPLTLDQHQSTDIIKATVMWHVYESLFTFDSSFRPIPMLAKADDVSPDGLIRTIALREGVRFHNGDEMTSADVVASIQRWGDLSSLGKSLLAATKDLVALDKYRVQFRLTEPFGPFRGALARAGQGCAIYPKSVIDAAGKQPVKTFIGTGPYRLAERQADRFIRLRRFDGYAALPGAPNGYGGHKAQHVDQIDFIPVPDEAARLAGLKAGDYHFLEQFSPDHYETLRDSPGLVTQQSAPWEYHHFALNMKSPLMANIKIRQAFQAALDHDAILQAAVGKFYRLDPSLMLKETVWHSTAGKELYNIRDRERARALLREARYDGTPLRFMCTQEWRYMYDEAVVARQHLEAAGFKVQLLLYDWATVVKHRVDEKHWDAYTSGHSFRSDPALLNFVLGCGQPGWWCTEQKVALAKRLQQGTEFDARYKVFEGIQRLCYEEAPMVKLGDPVTVTAFSSRLKGFDGLIQLQPEFSNVWLQR